MLAARLLRQARRRAQLTQRELATRTGVAQPTIARIESGESNPRVATLEHLLRECGETLDARPRAGRGVDRTNVREMLDRSPEERVATLAQEAAVVDRLVHARRRARAT